MEYVCAELVACVLYFCQALLLVSKLVQRSCVGLWGGAECSLQFCACMLSFWSGVHSLAAAKQSGADFHGAVSCSMVKVCSFFCQYMSTQR